MGPEICISGIQAAAELGAALGSALERLMIAYHEEAEAVGRAVVAGALSSGARILEAPSSPMPPALVLGFRRGVHVVYVHGEKAELWAAGLPAEVTPGPVRRAKWREIGEPLRVDPSPEYARILGRRIRREGNISLYSPSRATAELAAELHGGTAMWGERPDPSSTPGEVFVELDPSGTRILGARLGDKVLDARRAVATIVSRLGGGVLECTFPPLRGVEYRCGYRELVEAVVSGASAAGWTDGRIAVREFWSFPDAIAAAAYLRGAEPHPGWEEETLEATEALLEELRSRATRILMLPGMQRIQGPDFEALVSGRRVILWRL
ncbi:MAG: hypothetical protein J7J79_03220 [Thermoplasmata archaeon]|nr:hypothetical protein [Thermoplasmata archaeon]